MKTSKPLEHESVNIFYKVSQKFNKKKTHYKVAGYENKRADYRRSVGFLLLYQELVGMFLLYEVGQYLSTPSPHLFSSFCFTSSIDSLISMS